MRKIDIDSLMESLGDYEEDFLSDVGKSQMKDILIDLLEELSEDDDYFGWRYDERTILVELGNKFPKLYGIHDFISPLTGEKIRLRIVQIIDIYTVPNGNFAVRVLAERMSV